MPKDKSFSCLGSALCVCVFASKIAALALFLSVFVIGTPPAKAQESDTRNEFWPEIDVYINVKPKVRVYLIGTTSKFVEDGEIRNAQGFQAQIGAHVDYIPTDHLILRMGYRYGTSVGDTGESFKEHRLLTEQTLRKLLPGDLLLSDRNREDFRFVDGDFSFRYRNRVTIEREVHLFRGRTITPCLSGDLLRHALQCLEPERFCRRLSAIIEAWPTPKNAAARAPSYSGSLLHATKRQPL